MQAPPKKKGEIGELQDNLASTKLDQKKAAVRKVIFFVNLKPIKNKKNPIRLLKL